MLVGCIAGAQVSDGVCFVLSIYLAVLGLCGCAAAFSSCRERGCSVAAVRELVTAVASLVQHGVSLVHTQASPVVAHGLAAPRHVNPVFPARD